jgi:hypothetical protein
VAHIFEARVIGSHADVGPSKRESEVQPSMPDINGQHRGQPEETAAESRWDSEGGR